MRSREAAGTPLQDNGKSISRWICILRAEQGIIKMLFFHHLLSTIKISYLNMTMNFFLDEFGLKIPLVFRKHRS